ncbi:metallophosphoesterase [Aquicella siphonis]|nr:metallophosphoesterase [Aquicella siphonis]
MNLLRRWLCPVRCLMLLLVLCCAAAAAKPPSPLPAETRQTRFLALSDIHFDPFVSCGYTKPCPLIEKLRRAPSVQWAGIFAEFDTHPAKYGEDTNYPLLTSALAASRHAAEKSGAKFVMVLGDSLGHNFRSDYKKYSGDTSYSGFQAFTLKTFEFLTAQLVAAFPNLNIYIAVGNNDSYRGDYVTQPGGSFFRDVSLLWSRLLSEPADRKTMRAQFPRAGYYAVTLSGQRDLRLIILNTNLFSSKAKGQGISQAARAELDWLHEQLLQAKNRGQHVLVAMHIPEGVDVYATLRTRLIRLISLWKNEYIQRFQAELSQFAPQISGIFAGHLHSDWFQVLTFPNGHEVPVTGVPSISPVYGNNPGFKIYSYSNATLQIADYTTYYFPLNGGQSWLREYDFKRTYAQNCHQCPVVDGMNRLRPRGILADYYKSYYALQTKSQPITTQWNPYYWCAIHHVKPEDYMQCLN